jgi:hypothetical protein
VVKESGGEVKMTYTCAKCNNEYEEARSEEEALAEYADEFPSSQDEPKEVVCDDCYKEMTSVVPTEKLCREMFEEFVREQDGRIKMMVNEKFSKDWAEKTLLLNESISLLKQCDFYFEAKKTESIFEGDMHTILTTFLRKVEGE